MRDFRSGYIFGLILLAVVGLRVYGNFSGTANLAAAFGVLGSFTVLYVLAAFFSHRRGWAWPVYFLVQIAFIQCVAALEPFMDVSMSLYILLAMQAFGNRSQREAMFWSLAFIVLIGVTLIQGMGALAGLATSMLYAAEGIFLTTFVLLATQAQKDREESQVLVSNLQEAHQKLKEYTTQAGQLVAERERNRLARDLHDSVGQMIFSIQFLAESTRQLVERDPARVPALLDRLEDLTGKALGQLRSIITQLRLHA